MYFFKLNLMNDILGKYLEKIRINKVLPFVKGELLDIGCGMNNLKKNYGSGVGVDVYDWGNVDIVVEDTSNLPFSNSKFDTITILAALNHIPNRENVIQECYRVLKNDGVVIVTMIPPNISKIWHFIRKPWDKDQSERGMKDGELYGIKNNDIKLIFEKKGFVLLNKKKFMLNINNLLVFCKK